MREGWQIRPLGEVCEIYNGGTPSTNIPEYWDGGIQWITPKDMGRSKDMYVSHCERTISQEGVEHSSTKVLPERSVIVSSRAPIGYVAINEVPMATNQGCKGFVLGKEIYPEFLYYFLLSSTDLLNKLGTGATFKEVSGKKLAGIELPFPSIPEQQRIVNILDREFAKIDALKANAEKSLQAAKDLFQATLKKELEPKEGWISATLGKLYDVRDGTHDSPKYVSEGYPFITSKNLKDGKVDMSDVKFISQNDYEKINERSKVDIGDVLFAMIGSNLGHPAIVEEEPNYAIKNVALFKVPPSQSSRLLLFLLSSDKIMEVMNKEKNGSSQPFVSLKYLRNFVVSIPETRNEQENLAMSIQSISDRHKQLQQNYQKALTLCDDLKQALLRKAFNGEL